MANEIAETLRAALAHHQAGEVQAGERLYREVLAAEPDEPTALYLCGMLHLETGRLDAAEPLLARAVELRPNVAEGHLALATLALRQERQDPAIASFRKVLDIRPGHPVAVVNLASLLAQRGFAQDGDFESAVDVCRQATTLLPDPAPAHAMLGGLLTALGRTEEAIAAYHAALATQPSHASARAGLAAALVRSGRHEAAIEAADAALALDHRLPDAWLARGYALLALRQPQAAVEAFEAGVILAPELARAHLGLGDAYAEVDRDAEALQHLARASELDPASKWAHANLGSMLHRHGSLELAERHCRAALALDPEMAIAHQNLSGILAAKGEAEAARRHRDRAYGLRNLDVESAPHPCATVLALTTCDSGNIPHRHLLPKDRYTRIDWFIEYAHEGQAAELPAYDVVFNIIGDPDHGEATEAPVAAFLRGCPRPVLNDPARVAPTRRDRLPGLLAGVEGALVPKVARLDPAQAEGCDVAGWIEASGVDFPLLVRPIGSHGGEGLRLAEVPEDLAGLDLRGGGYATEFVDFASADGRYRKYRAIFVDRTAYPYHLAVKSHWLVHYYTAEMTGDAARQAEELRFLEDPAGAVGEGAMAAVAAIGRRLDLDFAGVDFSILPDGRVLVFEANATMLVHPEREAEFAYKNPFVERITSAFQSLVEARARQP